MDLESVIEDGRLKPRKNKDKTLCTCRHCSVKLVVGVNWQKSRAEKNEYTCADCRKIQVRQTIKLNGVLVKRKDPIWAGMFQAYGFGSFKSNHTSGVIPEIKEETTEGSIYMITNPQHLKDGWVAMGKAANLKSRLGDYQTYAPNRDFYVFHSIDVANRHTFEGLAFSLIEDMYGCLEKNYEWFRFKDVEAIQKAKEVLNTL